MAYFDHFDKLQYKPDKPDPQKTAVNIINSLIVKYEPIFNTTLFYYHNVQDGQRPEDIAYEFYKDASLHWIIILINNVVDPYFNWVLTQQELESYIDSKYDDVLDVHHFIDIRTDRWVDEYDFQRYYKDWHDQVPLPHYISPIINSMYEADENNKKRNIKVLQERYIEEFVNQFDELMYGYKYEAGILK